ncbi:hypothetical protein NDI54_06920 [Haloarcula sp. S1AR25-5A]|uniref:Uncharacterized protein n=1 Tax=Haloarcula terrestris TaxID=2950533 RepID=A0AAE4JG84_9EURY|nr:hypothetical protein [Haloarcula terrestris]MDS0221077.1 hypothetical protein [Haloarcula terrestris]
MAHLRDDSRGQLLLVAGLALALVFIGLALVVNSAIFTENLASRGETAGSSGALAARAATEANAGTAIEQANHYNPSAPVDAFNRSLRNVSTQTEALSATSGTLSNVTYAGHRNGKRVSGAIDRTNNSYTVADSVERVSGANGTRGLVFNASDLPGESTPLVVKVNDTTATGDRNSWRAQIWETTSDVHVKTFRNGTSASENRTERCSVPSSTANRIEVTAGLVNGQPCDALRRNDSGANFWFGNGAGDEYDVHFKNTNYTTGDFEMVVYSGGGPSILLTTLSDDAIYDAEVQFVYDGPDVWYNTSVRVAPGEPDA